MEMLEIVPVCDIFPPGVHYGSIAAAPQADAFGCAQG